MRVLVLDSPPRRVALVLLSLCPSVPAAKSRRLNRGRRVNAWLASPHFPFSSRSDLLFVSITNRVSSSLARQEPRPRFSLMSHVHTNSPALTPLH